MVRIGDKDVPIWNVPSFTIDWLLQNVFYGVGHCTASLPITVLVLSCLLTSVFGIGIMFIQFETDPQKLWVPDQRFVPPYSVCCFPLCVCVCVCVNL
jgi:hypothetical protein